MTDGPERMSARIRGRVQGVGYRWFTRREAQALGLAGWVRNESDGSVRVEAEGPRDDLEAFAARLRTGPPGSRVADIDLRFTTPTGNGSAFEIR